MLQTLLTLAVAIATTLQAPVRDTTANRQAPSGSAAVSGVVTLGDETHTPVRRAVVILTPSDGSGSRSAVSDDEGRFTLNGLPEGRYALQAEKAAHPTMALGARRPGRRGTDVILAAGEHLRDLRLALPRGGVLAGKLTLDDGRPASSVQVVAIPARLVRAGGTQSSLVREFRSDDNGDFRIYGLPPDTYIVGALPQFGRGEIERRTTAENDALVRWLRRPQGERTAANTSGPPSSAVVGFAPVYFPGVATAMEARPIVLGSGEVREDIGFTVAPLPLSTIRGIVTDVHGLPVQAAAITVARTGPPLPFAFSIANVNLPNARGEFEISGLAPGHYVVRARAGGVTLGVGGDYAVRSSAQTHWARTELTIDGFAIDGVALTLGPGLSFAGTLKAAVPVSPSWMGTLVRLQPIRVGVNTEMAGLTGGVTAREATVDREGRFTVTGLEPDTYEIQVRLPSTLIGDGWALASVLHQGRDVRDTPLTFATGSIVGVEVVLTTAVTELSGRLTTGSGSAATDYFIVVFPSNPELWHVGSPRTALLRPSADGRFHTKSLPPGAYRMAALVDVEADELKDRSFLDAIYDASLPVVLTEGRMTLQDLRIR